MNAIEIIKQKRKELGITQDELSKKIGLSETAINKTEMGTRQLKLEDFKILSTFNRTFKVPCIIFIFIDRHNYFFFLFLFIALASRVDSLSIILFNSFF